MSDTPVDPQFVLEHAAHVRALARRLVFDATGAADLEQETWLAALRNAPRGMTSPRGWLARIAQRRAVHDWRAESRREAREQSVARPEQVASSAEILEREEVRSRIVRAVLELDEPYRAALVAQFLEERPPRDAAKARGVPVETQRTHVKRGIELLRQRLKRGHGAAFGAFQLALVRDLRLEPPFGTTLAAAGSGIAIGGLTMWTAKKVVVMAAIAIVLVLGATRPWEATGTSSSATSAAPSGAPDLAAAVDIAAPREPESLRRASESPSTAAETVRAAAPSPTAAVVVLARVVDESGRPIRGARGVLAARGRWNADVDPSATFEALTGDDGALRIEAPLLTADRADLEVEADPYRTRAAVRFDADAMRVLAPGTNDVGELVLGPAGRILGRVLVEGRPVAGAVVSTRSPLPSIPWRRATSGEDGRFALAHVDPATTELQTDGEGLVESSMTVFVLPGRDADVGDVVLARATSIAGVVVDQDGAPCAGVRIEARSAKTDVSESGRSDAEGRFRVHVPVSGEYDLLVADTLRFLRWGGPDAPGARFATGDESARIMLTAVARTTFRIVDAKTRQPILEIGLAVRDVGRGRSALGPDEEEFEETWPRIVARSSNEVGERAQPGLHEVLVASPGHVPFRAAVLHDTEDAPVQTIRLERGRVLRGRVVRDGLPLTAVQVGVERALVPLGPKPQVPGSIELGHTHARDVSAFAGRARNVVTVEAGTFEFTDLPPGTFDLRAAFGGVVGARLELLHVPADGALDVGDVVFRAGATIRGVIDAGEHSPIGWLIGVSGRKEILVDRADGRFEVAGLPSGPVELYWYQQRVPGLESEVALMTDTGRSMRLELAEGETRDVRIDVAELAPARVTIRVLADGEPVADSVVWACALREGGGRRCSSNNATGSDGHWSGLFRPGVEYEFQATLPEGMLLASSPRIALAPGETRELRIEGRTGTLEVRLPASLALPEQGYVAVEVTTRGGPPSAIVKNNWYRDVPSFSRTQHAWVSAQLDVGRVGAGEWTLHVAPNRMTATGASSWSHEALMPKVEIPITIRPGEMTVVQIP